jgi:hypothetical protein
MTEDECKAWEADLDAAGIRRFPYPFATILAIVSDCDKCCRIDFNAYRSRFVDELGLDFGDSCKLMTRSPGSHYHDSLCIYRYDGAGHPHSEENRFLDEVFGFVEMLREIHLGNIDHYHYFHGAGPRLYFLPDITSVSAGCWSAAMPSAPEAPPGGRNRKAGQFNFSGPKLPITTVVVQPRHGALPQSTTVRLVLRDGHQVDAEYRRCEWGEGRWKPRFTQGEGRAAIFTSLADDPPEKLPLANQVERVEIQTPQDGGAIELEAVFLLNVQRDIVVRMMDEIYGTMQFRTNLLTDHGSRLHIDTNSERRHSKANGDRAWEGYLSALSCRVDRDDLFYSVLGDDPESYMYLLQPLRDRWGVRFINPGGASGEIGAHIDMQDVVLPTLTRDGSSIYLARRCAGTLPETGTKEKHPLHNDQGTRTFPTRLAELLNKQPDHPGAVYPMYNHVGNIKPKTDRPDPYYPQPVFERLQDRVFNISGKTDYRVWFTRGTLLYDYSLIIRSIAPNVSRPDGNTAEITSWDDAVLGQRLPVSPSQLHGLTFYVDDRSAGRVRLDGKEIAELVRNPADETGRESITIVGADIRHVLIDEVDVDPTLDGVSWNWIDDPKKAARGNAYARITLDRDGIGIASWKPGDVRPSGTQFLSWCSRTKGDARSAVLVETETGGRFLFGDLLPHDGPLTASYECAQVATNQWNHRIAPFYDLRWDEKAEPGGPLPSHRIVGVHLIVQGRAGSSVCFDRLEFLRPLTTSHELQQRRIIVGGQVLEPRSGMRVHLRIEGDERVIDLVDPQGLFFFTDVPRNTVGEMWIEDGESGETWISRRGRHFTLASNDLTHVVDARAS